MCRESSPQSHLELRADRPGAVVEAARSWAAPPPGKAINAHVIDDGEWHPRRLKSFAQLFGICFSTQSGYARVAMFRIAAFQ